MALPSKNLCPESPEIRGFQGVPNWNWSRFQVKVSVFEYKTPNKFHIMKNLEEFRDNRSVVLDLYKGSGSYPTSSSTHR
jgi:hypothetical protein